MYIISHALYYAEFLYTYSEVFQEKDHMEILDKYIAYNEFKSHSQQQTQVISFTQQHSSQAPCQGF